MFKYLLPLIFLSASITCSSAQTHGRMPLETPQAFAERLKPKDTELAHNIIETGIWTAPGKAILAFYKFEGNEEESGDSIVGYIYYPIDSLHYKKVELEAIWGEAGNAPHILAVFFANTDQDPDKELLVLFEIPFSTYDVYGKFYGTQIYDKPTSASSKLFNNKKLSEQFFGCDCIGTDRPESDQKGRNDVAKFKTAQAIKAELKRLGY